MGSSIHVLYYHPVVIIRFFAVAMCIKRVFVRKGTTSICTVHDVLDTWCMHLQFNTQNTVPLVYFAGNVHEHSITCTFVNIRVRMYMFRISGITYC
jgi:hypothetical protein